MSHHLSSLVSAEQVFYTWTGIPTDQGKPKFVQKKIPLKNSCTYQSIHVSSPLQMKGFLGFLYQGTWSSPAPPVSLEVSHCEWQG